MDLYIPIVLYFSAILMISADQDAFPDADALHKACFQGQYDKVGNLIQNGADINAKSRDGRTCLNTAIYWGFESLAEMLIENGVNVNLQNNNGVIPILQAVYRGHMRIVEVLLKNGANINGQSGIGESGLHTAAKFGQLSMVEFLLKNGADINLKDNNAQSPIFLALLKGYDRVVEILIKNGADVNIRDKTGSALIHHAAVRDGQVRFVKLLVENGANVNIQNNNGESPLLIASKLDNLSTVELLIKNGADVNLKDNFDQVPILVATLRGHVRIVEILFKNGADNNLKNAKGEVNNTLIYVAALRGETIIVKILIENGTDPNIRNNNGAPIHAAALKGHGEVVKLLINNGANVNSQNNDGKTALHVLSNSSYIVAVLIENGANVNIQDRNGSSPLHAAVQNGFENIIEFLLEFGADTNLKNKNNESSMELAARIGNEKVIKLLKTIRPLRAAKKACKLNVSAYCAINDDDEFLWMASLGYLNTKLNYLVSFDCAGIIISNNFVLTTAHCVNKRQPVMVKFGKVSSSWESDLIYGDIKNIIVHPDYSALTKKHDIALIQVEMDLPVSNDDPINIIPVCLQTDEPSSSGDLFSAEWKTTSTEQPENANKLNKKSMRSVPLSKCNATLLHKHRMVEAAGLQNGLIEGQYCAYPVERNYNCDAGNAESLYDVPNYRKSETKVVGIASFGISCGESLPIIYTRIKYYLDWIEPIVWPYLKMATDVLNERK